MPYKGKAATQSGQGNDTIQPNSDTYMCHALAMKTRSEDTKTVQPNSDTYMCHALANKTRSEDTKTKAPIQKKIVALTSKEDFPVPLAGRARPENSADAPALSGCGGTMRESPHPPNEAPVHINPLSNVTCEPMYNMWSSDPVRTCGSSNPVYGHDLKGQGTDPDTDLRPASMEPYAVRYQEEDADDDKDHRPANMEPYAVRYQEEDDDDDKDDRPASMQSYAVSTSRNDAGTSGNDGTSVPRKDDRSMRGTRKPRHAQGVPHGPREAAGGTTPMQQTDWQARADAAASIPNPMYASRADRTYSGRASGCRALCSFICSHLSYLATGIAVLLSLVAVGLALMAFIKNEEISELATTVDAVKRDQDDIRQLPTTVDALTRDQDDMRQLSTTVDALTRDQDDMRQLSTTVDALTRDQDDMRQLSTTVDALTRDLDKERSRTGPILEQRLDETSKTPGVVEPLVLDFDPLTDYMYWSDRGNNNIRRARRDGSGMETIIDTDDSTISVAKKDGSSARTLLTSPAINIPYELVLDPRNGTANSDPNIRPYAVTHELTMPYKGKAGTQSGQGKDTIQPNSDTYMCDVLSGRDRPENSAEAPALSGSRETPHPPNEASVHMDPLSNITYEHMYNPWPSDPVRTCGTSNPVYGHDLKGTDPDTDLRPAGMEPYAVRYQEEDAADDKDHRPASMEPYAIRYQEEDADDDKDHQPDSMEPNTVSTSRTVAGTSGNDTGTSRNVAGTSRNDAGTSGNDAGTSGNDTGTFGNDAGTCGNDASIYENDAGTYENDADTSGNDAGTCGKDTGTSVPRRDDRNKRGTRKPRHAQGVPHGGRKAAGGTTPMQQTDWQARADAAASIPNPMYASGADRTDPGGASGRCALCSFIRSKLTYIATGIAVLLGLVTVGLAFAVFINNKRDQNDMHQLSTTVDALKRGQDDMRQLSTTVDALKRDQDDMRQLSTTVDALKRDQDDMRQLSTTIDALKSDQDDMHQLSTTVDALKRDQDDIRQLPTTVDALKRDQDDMRQLSTTVDALKRDQDDIRQLSTTVDALKRDQDDMRQLSTTVDALKRDQDDIRQLPTTVDALKRDQDDIRQLPTTVDALKRDQDDMRQLPTTVDALKRDQDDIRQLPTTVDALKRDLDKERSRTGPTLEHETSQKAGDHDSRKNSEPFLLVADCEKGTIIQVDITSGSKVTLPLVGVGWPCVLDYDPLTDYVYWTNGSHIKRARRDGSGMETIIDTGSTLVYYLALDHAGGEIYWSVAVPETISVAKMDGSSARTLLTSPAIGHPEQLVLDPRHGLMYWVDGPRGRIDRAAMDGSGPTTIITGLRRPCSITIDFNEDRLYYRDQKYGIYSSDLLGNDIRQVLYEHGKWVGGIAVDEDFIYWASFGQDYSSSSSSQGKIGKLSKSDLNKTVLVDGLDYPYGIYLSTAAPPGVTNGAEITVVVRSVRKNLFSDDTDSTRQY
uniref:Uncharacterized protein n=1 Tax=Branchiostoma floridae TaxID=7739 RepID=C3YXU8_BRAFL|eukprot:XP_002598895.1 hypothetical protein BRAFLDRAFT_125740 [Branchiostoma floridae]